MRLNVGDRVYAIHYNRIVGVYVIARTTKTQAMVTTNKYELIRFRQDDTNSIRPVHPDKWSSIYYEKETDALKQQLILQRLRDDAKALFDVNKLTAEQLEQIIAIITKND